MSDTTGDQYPWTIFVFGKQSLSDSKEFEKKAFIRVLVENENDIEFKSCKRAIQRLENGKKSGE